MSDVIIRLAVLGGAAGRAAARKVGAGLKELGDDADVANGKLDGAGKVGGALGGVLKSVAAVALPAAGFALFDAAKKAMSFQAQMEKIHTQAGAAQSQVSKLTPAVLALAKTLPQGPQELAAGLYHLESIGLRNARAMNALKVAAQGAAVGNADLEDTATALGSAWLVNIKGAGNLQHVMGVLNAAVGSGNMKMGDLVEALGKGLLPAAKLAGLSLQDAMGALAVFTDEGYPASSAAAQLATSLHYLYDPGAKAADALHSIGLSTDALGLAMHKPDGLLNALTTLKDHLNQLPGGWRGVQAEQVLGNILPGGRGRILEVLLNQLTRYQMKLKQIHNTSDSFGSDVAATMRTAAYKIHTAWSTMEVDLIKFGSKILPIAAKAIGAGAKMFDEFSTGIMTGRRTRVTRTRLKNGEGGVLGGVLGARFKVHRQPVAQQIGADFRDVGQFLTGKVVPTAVRAVKALLNALKPAVPFFKNVLLPLIKGIGEGIMGTFVGVFKIAVVVIKAAATILGVLGDVLKPLKPIFSAIGTVIGFIVGGALLKLIFAAEKVVTVFKLIKYPVDLVGDAIGVLGRAIGGLLDWFGKIWMDARRWIATFENVGSSIATSIGNGIQDVINWITQLPKIVMDALGKVGDFVDRVGGTLWKGLKDGFVAAINFVIGAINTLINAYNDSIGALAGVIGVNVKVSDLNKIGASNGTSVAGVAKTLTGRNLAEYNAVAGLVGLQKATGTSSHHEAKARTSVRRMPVQAAGDVTIHVHVHNDVKTNIDKKTVHRAVYEHEEKVLAAR